MKEKTSSLSETIKTEVVCPNDTNPMGILQGGKLVQWMDIAAAVTAQTHADGICVTVSIDKMGFHHSAKVGDIIRIKAKITRVFTSSMEIKVESFGRNILEPQERLVGRGYFTFVAIDGLAKPRSLPPMTAETEEELNDYNEAAKRRKEKK